MVKIGFFVMNKKGLEVLEIVEKNFGIGVFSFCVGSRDPNVANDYYSEIEAFCVEKKIQFLDRNNDLEHLTADACFSIGWRWLIKGKIQEKLIVTHDSLLPKYRGFAPLVNMLLSGEKRIGVTFLKAAEEYDRGEIFLQKSIRIKYPIIIEDAINIIGKLFALGVMELISKMLQGKQLNTRKQNEKYATYSLWRDEEDYKINWNSSAEKIRNFVNAVGFPYLGASSLIDGKKVRILEVQIKKDVVVESRITNIGKVIQIKNDNPLVICGKGVIEITKMINDEEKTSALPLKKFRSRFE